MLGFCLWALDFFSSVLGSYIIGGTHFYGRAAGGEYSVAFGAAGPFKPVSAGVYYYSVYHWWSVVTLACIFVPAMLVYLLAGGLSEKQQSGPLPIT